MISMMLLYCTLLLASTSIQLVAADYHIGYSINSYNNPSNSLSDSTCCDGTCMAGSCRTTLRLCFRDTDHSRSDLESDCLAARNHENVNFFSALATDEPSIHLYYQSNSFSTNNYAYFINGKWIRIESLYVQEKFQLYIRVSHSEEQNMTLADFDPPFTDPHIDDIFIQADIAAITYESLNLVSSTYTKAGESGRATMSVSLNVRCAQNYYGSACEMLCDANGINCETVLEPPTLTSSTTDNIVNESTATMLPDMTTDSPSSSGEIDTNSSMSTPTTLSSGPTGARPTNATTRRMPPSRLSAGFLAGIIVACVLIFIGIIVITLTVIAVAVCVYRKQRKNIHKLTGGALEVNEIYEPAITPKENGTMTTIVDDNQSETGSVQYESMDTLRDAMQIPSDSVYDRVDPVVDDADDGYINESETPNVQYKRDAIQTESNSAYDRVDQVVDDDDGYINESDTPNVQYKRDAIQTEANSAYDRVDKVVDDDECEKYEAVS